MDFYEKWLEDVPAQFKKGLNLQAIIEAFAIEMNQLAQVYYDLVELTTLDKAKGQILTDIGSIVDMTRLEAFSMLRDSLEKETYRDMTDEEFRRVVKFEILRRNSDGTYNDIMHGFELLWGEGVEAIQYEDNPYNKPATIGFSTQEIESDAEDPFAFKPLVIRPAGVDVIFYSRYLDHADVTGFERFGRMTLRYPHYYMYNGELVYDGTGNYSGEKTRAGEIDMAYAVILNQTKQKVLDMRASGDKGWKIAQMAFGTGKDEDGNKYTVSPSQTELRNERYRTAIKTTKLEDGSYRYTASIPESELIGEYVSEIGLVDVDGMMLCIKTFDGKLKDGDAEMMFTIDNFFEEGE